MTDKTDPLEESTFATVQRVEPPDSDEAEIDLGTIGPYKLLRELGRGGMGAVYLAKHINLQRLVAIKVLPQELSDSPERLERFRREMAAIGRLEHPNIVLATDAGDADGVAYIAMQYVEGTDVNAIHKRDSILRIADASEIVRQASLGLQHVLECGLVHRDIKPSNLFLTKKGDIKILDLGLAMLRDRDGKATAITAANSIMGTPDYIAPEQINYCHRVDIRADIYSLGCTLYALLAGKAPFDGQQYSTTTSKLVAHAEKQPVSLKSIRSDVPNELVRIVEKMMAKSPSERYSEPKEVGEALADWSVGSNLLALADPNANEVVSPIRPRGPASTIFSRKAMVIASVVGIATLVASPFFVTRKVPLDLSKDGTIQNGKPELVEGNSQSSPTSTDVAAKDLATSQPAGTPADQLSTIASSIDRSTQQISQSTQLIESSNQKVEENTRRIAQSFDELIKRLDGPLGNKLVNNPQTPGEHYYNAIVYGMQGNARTARQSFLAYFEADQDYIDPHLKFIESLKLQEGIASAREIYKSLPGNRSFLSRQFAEANLLETEARIEVLKSMASLHEDFAPAWYALGNLYSTSPGVRQTFLESTQELGYLKFFLAKHKQGGLLKYYLDPSEAATLVSRAESRLKALELIDQEMVDHPISLTLAMKLADHWLALIEVAEPAKEIFFRVGETGEFQSTGKLPGIDPATGQTVPKKSFDISKDVTKTLLHFRYVDLKGQMRGPFSIPFDAQEQTIKWERQSIEQTKSGWLRLAQDRLFFDVFHSGRSVLSQVHYGVDSETPQRIKKVPKAPLSEDNSQEYYEVIPATAKFAVIQLKFADGKESEIVRIERKE